MDNFAQNAIFEGVSATKYFSDRGNQPTVYKETELPAVKSGKTRIWISFDIENDPQKNVRKKLYDWFNAQIQIESWGNSVATFLVNACMVDEDVQNYIVNGLKQARVFNLDDWKKTPNVSLYISYRTKILKEDKTTWSASGHFVLIQNAKIMQPSGFKC